MTVTAIIPTFNRKSCIRRAIDSVLQQSVPVDEVIVVDDGSTDGTAEAIGEWYGTSVRVVRQSNTGVSGARHRGVAEAHGEWIAFLDSDDEWTSDRNKQFLQAVGQVPSDVAWIFGDVDLVTDEANLTTTLFRQRGLAVDGLKIFSDSLSVQFPFQFGLLQASFIRRKVLMDLECFVEGLRSSEDLLAGFQVACRYRFAAIPQVVTRHYRTSDLDSTSLAIAGTHDEDYFRARMLAFEIVIQSGRRKPWNRHYAAVTREFCKLRLKKDESPRRFAFQQFRYGGLSLKGIGFFCAALAGRRGLSLWDQVAGLKSKVMRTNKAEPWQRAEQVQNQILTHRT